MCSLASTGPEACARRLDARAKEREEMRNKTPKILSPKVAMVFIAGGLCSCSRILGARSRELAAASQVTAARTSPSGVSFGSDWTRPGPPNTASAPRSWKTCWRAATCPKQRPTKAARPGSSGFPCLCARFGSSPTRSSPCASPRSPAGSVHFRTRVPGRKSMAWTFRNSVARLRPLIKCLGCPALVILARGLPQWQAWSPDAAVHQAWRGSMCSSIDGDFVRGRVQAVCRHEATW